MITNFVSSKNSKMCLFDFRQIIPEEMTKELSDRDRAHGDAVQKCSASFLSLLSFLWIPRVCCYETKCELSFPKCTNTYNYCVSNCTFNNPRVLLSLSVVDCEVLLMDCIYKTANLVRCHKCVVIPLFSSCTAPLTLTTFVGLYGP